MTTAPPRTPPKIAPRFDLRLRGGGGVGVGVEEVVVVLVPVPELSGREAGV